MIVRLPQSRVRAIGALVLSVCPYVGRIFGLTVPSLGHRYEADLMLYTVAFSNPFVRCVGCDGTVHRCTLTYELRQLAAPLSISSGMFFFLRRQLLPQIVDPHYVF